MPPDVQETTARVRREFDRIAALPDDGWNHNSHYHSFLLKHLPPRCGSALELGCGTGVFTRALARRAERVVALDLSPGMIAVARSRGGNVPNIAYQITDALAWDWPAARFDCIAAIATLHHLPLEAMLRTMRDALAENGVLLVLDLYHAQGLGERLTRALALPLSSAARLAHTGHLRPSPAARAAWAEHGRHDRHPTLAHVRQACVSLLPGARVRRHLFLRYSIVWRKTPSHQSPAQ